MSKVIKKRDKTNYLTSISEIWEAYPSNPNKKVCFVKCLCICGKEKITRKCDFVSNKTTSCGCISGRKVEKREISALRIGQVFGKLTVESKTTDKSTEGSKYLCRCSCGNSVTVYANRLKREETKSCGCSSSYYNSINNGGNGIAYSYLPVQKAIRACEKYQTFIKLCLKRANGKSEFSGIIGHILHVHHLDSVSYLIKKYELTLDSYLECTELFDMNNAIVLTETEHRAFHKDFNASATVNDWNTYKQKELIIAG